MKSIYMYHPKTQQCQYIRNLPGDIANAEQWGWIKYDDLPESKKPTFNKEKSIEIGREINAVVENIEIPTKKKRSRKKSK